MPVRVVGFALGLAIVATHAQAPARAYDPTTAYQRRTVQGFTVLVNKNLAGHEDVADAVYLELTTQLRAIAAAVPPVPLGKLRETRIWLEWTEAKDASVVFHPSGLWLRDHGHNPDKAGGVVIDNPVNFLEGSRGGQRGGILNALALAYHFRMPAEEQEAVQGVYRGAMDRNLYAAVPDAGGVPKEAPARQGPAMYFAELTKSYFDLSDYFPFTRGELGRYDPEGYRHMQQIWGRPPARKPKKK